MESETEKEVRPLVCRAANQAARAVVKVIEEQTGKDVSLYDATRLVNVMGNALERNGLEGGPSGEIRSILEQPYVPNILSPDQPDEQSVAHKEPHLIGKFVTVVYQIENPTAWRKTNPLEYAHDGIRAAGVSIGDLMERRDSLRSALERIAEENFDGIDPEGIAEEALKKDDAAG